MPIYRFHTEIAQMCGLAEAALFYHIAYWVRNNRRSGRNYHDEKYWVYESAHKLAQERHNYLSEHQIRRALQHLVEEGLLLRGIYNHASYDRTYSYTLTEKADRILQNCEKELADPQDGTRLEPRPIPMENH